MLNRRRTRSPCTCGREDLLVIRTDPVAAAATKRPKSFQMRPATAENEAMRSRKTVVLITAMLGAGLAAAGPSVAATTYAPQWSTTFDGWNRSSSPAIADIDGDGKNEIVMGHQDGVLRAFEADGTLKWSSPAIPGDNTGCNAQTTASEIDSSPAVADLDQDGTAEIIVGVGSTWVSSRTVAWSHSMA